MALIKCPDCKNDVSDSAVACPKCGCPVAKIVAKKDLLQKEQVTRKRAEASQKATIRYLRSIALTCFMVFLISLIALISYMLFAGAKINFAICYTLGFVIISSLAGFVSTYLVAYKKSLNWK